MCKFNVANEIAIRHRHDFIIFDFFNKLKDDLMVLNAVGCNGVFASKGQM